MKVRALRDEPALGLLAGRAYIVLHALAAVLIQDGSADADPAAIAAAEADYGPAIDITPSAAADGADDGVAGDGAESGDAPPLDDAPATPPDTGTAIRSRGR